MVDRPSGRTRSAAAAYALAVATLVAAVGLRYVLDPWMRDSLPLVTIFGAVAAAVWLGGYRPAGVVAILVENPASRALREGVVVGLENHFATVRHGCPAIDRGLRG